MTILELAQQVLAEGEVLVCPKCHTPLSLGYGVVIEGAMVGPVWVLGHATKGCGRVEMHSDANEVLTRFYNMRKDGIEQ